VIGAGVDTGDDLLIGEVDAAIVSLAAVFVHDLSAVTRSEVGLGDEVADFAWALATGGAGVECDVLNAIGVDLGAKLVGDFALVLVGLAGGGPPDVAIPAGPVFWVAGDG
jgi:hypothetical protein